MRRGKTPTTVVVDEPSPLNANEVIAKHISDAAQNGIANRFILKGPRQLSVKNAKGEYRKWAIPGESVFEITAAYVGKRDGVIIVMKPQKPSNDFKFVEIPADSAKDALTGFQNYWDAIMTVLGPEIAAQEEALRQKALASELDQILSHPNALYGTW